MDMTKRKELAMTVSALFKKERQCKHSLRYTPVDEEGKKITAVVYLMNDSVIELNNPAEILITITAKE